jgi:hypothetical protein
MVGLKLPFYQASLACACKGAPLEEHWRAAEAAQMPRAGPEGAPTCVKAAVRRGVERAEVALGMAEISAVFRNSAINRSTISPAFDLIQVPGPRAARLGETGRPAHHAARPLRRGFRGNRTRLSPDGGSSGLAVNDQ